MDINLIGRYEKTFYITGLFVPCCIISAELFCNIPSEYPAVKNNFSKKEKEKKKEKKEKKLYTFKK
jgi:hypothetical protein